MAGPTSRLLSLLSLLQTSRTWSGSELADRLEITHRTVRRDIDRLREMGYPIEADLGAHGGYRLVAGSSMPPLLLEDDEAVAVALGLRTIAVHGLPELEDAGVRALTKLSQSLPARLRYRVHTLAAAAMSWGPRSGTAVDPDVLTVLAAATANRERVRLSYEDRGGRFSARHVEPQRLVNAGQHWYFIAFDIERDDWRHFRVDRITQPRGTGVRSREILREEDMLRHLEHAELAMAPTYRADITLHLPMDEARSRLRDHLGDGELIAEGEGTRWRSGIDTVEWLAMRLLLLDCHFVVHAPQELRDHLDRIHERTRNPEA
ncbi:helix-turn-helix transcriptional regulator [Microbacterium aurantiacum]|uniref:helix-turn-helix transcriptional regulator n=1 Tax=Microbacterium aurantiacum TaxID=162393 RepID=UPI000C8053E0|nr:YafY family protein [Microbacterium aurantiacum]